MKNVLIVVPDDRLGGAEQYLKNLAYYHLEIKDKVTVVFLKKQLSGHWQDLQNLGDVTFYFSNSKTELGGLSTSFRNLLKFKKITFDFIYTSHLHTTSFAGLLIRLGLVKKQNFVGRESTSIFRRFKGKQLFIFKTLYRLGYPSVDLLINQSELMKDQLIQGLPWIGNKTEVKVIPNPINLKAIQEFSVNKSRLHPSRFIVSAGRLIPEKGYDLLISAYKILAEEYPELDLLILGEGFKRFELEEQIKSLGLTDRIFLKGHVENVYDYFKQAEVCVVSSRIEGFPNVLLQMMSQNNKVISTKCAGGIDKLKGVVCAETEDVESLQKAIKYALKRDLKENQSLFSKQLEERSLSNFHNKIQEYLIVR